MRSDEPKRDRNNGHDGAADDQDSRRHARETVAGMTEEDLQATSKAPYDRYIITDCDDLGALYDVKARFIVLEPDRSIGPEDLPALTKAARQGRNIFTWCSKDKARSVAQAVAKKFDELMPGTKRVRHIELMTPADFIVAEDNGNAEIEDMYASASPKLPAALKPKSQPRAGAAPANKAAAADRHYTSSITTAEQVLLAHPGDLLVVDRAGGGFSDLRVLSPVGIWESGDTTLLYWLGNEIRESMRDAALAAAQNDQIDDKALPGVLNSIRRLGEPDRLKPMKLQAVSALRGLLERGELKEGDVTTCDVTKLDADLRYLGTASGVVDLHAAKRLEPEEGRKALVTLSTDVAFDPGAEHPAVDKLFAHLDPEAIGWWWRALGFALLGKPSRRVYFAIGPKKAGKTTLIEALAETLGPYASTPPDSALAATKLTATAALTPEMEGFTAPHRLALIDEVSINRINSRLLKRLSGDGRVTYRRLHEQLQTRKATATILMAANDGSVPKLDLQDEAMADRLRELPYPKVPKEVMDEDLKGTTVPTDEFRRAFLSRLVQCASRERPNNPPKDVPVVRQATDARIQEDAGELGEFSRRIVRGGNLLPFSDVWSAWCEVHQVNETEKEAGGISKNRFTRALQDHVPELKAPLQRSVGGKNVKAWPDWRLLTPEEAEARAADQAEANGAAVASGAAADGPPPTTTVDFVNEDDTDLLSYSWRNHDGGETHYGVVNPGETVPQSTYVGHEWIVRDRDGVRKKIEDENGFVRDSYRAGDKPGRAIRRKGAADAEGDLPKSKEYPNGPGPPGPSYAPPGPPERRARTTESLRPARHADNGGPGPGRLANGGKPSWAD